MVERAAIVVPVYKREPSESERLSFRRCIAVLGSHPIILFAPTGIDLSAYSRESTGLAVRYFDPSYFRSVHSYSRLMLSESFYASFQMYEYILIYQLDAYVFSDRLSEFCALDYDYIGAPWINRLPCSKFRGGARLKRIFKLLPLTYECEVGNGGFSLRRTQAMLAYLRRHPRAVRRWKFNEDLFWSVAGKKHPAEIRVAPLEVALSFAFEIEPSRSLALNHGKLPFGCHAFDKYEPEVYRQLFQLSEVQVQLRMKDC
jgi:hypothetical protein